MTRRVNLASTVGAREVGNLTEYCTRMYATGGRALMLELSAVTSCDRDGLEGLTALIEGSSGLAIDVAGARWGQFLALLGSADVVDVRALHGAVRALVRRA